MKRTATRSPMPRQLRRARSGFVLIVVLGMLALLSILATTYLTLARTERQAAENFVVQTRAMMLAVSGIEYAIARLRSSAAVAGGHAYGGEDWNGQGEATGTPDGSADDANGNRNGVVDVFACDPEFARRPSFFVDDDRDGLPDLIRIVEGGVTSRRGYSGRVAGTFHEEGDHFVLKVTGSSGQVSVNQKGDGYRKLYDNLGVLALNPPVRDLGTRIQGSQPYSTVDDLLLKGVLTGGQLDVLRPYLTTFAWVDPSTIRPDPQFEPFQRPENLRRQSWIEPRAPIDVNTADFLVLKSCFLGLAGYSADRAKPKKKNAMVLKDSQADDLARAILLARAETFTDSNGNQVYDDGEPFIDVDGDELFCGPFRTWHQFESFVASVPGFGQKRPKGKGWGFGQLKKKEWGADLVCANANPNTLLNCLQPDHQLRRAIDKSDLIASTTEFCFESTGTYVIRSLGRVTSTFHEVLATREIECEVRLFDLSRLTTQEDFEGAEIKVLSSPDVMSIPEEVAGIVTESYDDVNDNGRFDAKDTFTDLNGDGMRDGPALYDGQLCLRPSDPPETAPWGDHPSQLAFRCLFNDSPTHARLGPDQYPSLSADIAEPTLARGIPLSAGDLRTSVEGGGSLLRDLTGSDDYPDLGPNGLFVREETGELIYWNSILNWPVGAGSIRFWLKPTWETHPAANQYKDVLALNQNYSLDPNRGRLVLLDAVHFGPKPGLFKLEGHCYTRTRSTRATETTPDPGFDPPTYVKSHYHVKLKGDWTPDQWHDFSLRYTDQIRFSAWLDAIPFDVLHESKMGGSDSATLGNPSPTYNHMALGSEAPWSDKIGTGTYDDFLIYRSAVPASDAGLTPAWRYDDTGVPGWGEYVGRMRLPAGARVRSLAWTEWRPTLDYQGDDLSSTASEAARKRPDVRFFYRAQGEAAWRPAPRPTDPDAWDGGPISPDPGMPPTNTVEFRFLFDRNGQNPFRNSPAVDDVTFTYTGGAGVVVLSWRILP